ncbi:MAG: DUF1269 domain-containing protein, partial [Anaerolineae bacterium]|nr:DUF1269 domain-containing protein [Anaerolineae bacterium]
MDTMIVTVFEDEAAAFEAWRALQDLHARGDIFLYGMAVVNKDANQGVEVKHAFAPSPEGTAAGMVVGGALGLVGGPVGVAVGAATGALAGSLFDVAHIGFDADYMDEVSAALEPGTTALVAEVDEGWTTPVDSRMQALGGRVTRSHPADEVDA